MSDGKQVTNTGTNNEGNDYRAYNDGGYAYKNSEPSGAYYNTGNGHAFYENKSDGYGYHENQNTDTRTYYSSGKGSDNAKK